MPAGERGFAFVAVLMLLATVMLGLAVAGPLWSQQARRDKEQELLRVGALYARALASYRDRSPGSAKQYPARLDDLLEDRRFVGLMRHLRTLYPDPVNPGPPWGLVLDADQRITGVYSQSPIAPVIEGPVQTGSLKLAPARHYSDWKFSPQVQP